MDRDGIKAVYDGIENGRHVFVGMVNGGQPVLRVHLATSMSSDEAERHLEDLIDMVRLRPMVEPPAIKSMTIEPRGGGIKATIERGASNEVVIELLRIIQSDVVAGFHEEE